MSPSTSSCRRVNPLRIQDSLLRTGRNVVAFSRLGRHGPCAIPKHAPRRLSFARCRNMTHLSQLQAESEFSDDNCSSIEPTVATGLSEQFFMRSNLYDSAPFHDYNPVGHSYCGKAM